mgnify:CR=1 FL=1
MNTFVKEIDNLVEKYRSNQTTVQQLEVQYRKNSSQKNIRDYILIKGEERSILPLEEEYYENLYEHLEYIYYQLIQPLADLGFAFNMNFKIDEEGIIILHDVSIDIIIQVNATKNRPITETLYHNILNISALHKHMKQLNVKGDRYTLSLLRFQVVGNSRLITKTLKSMTPNKTISNKWLADIDFITQMNKNNHTYDVEIPILNSVLSLDLRVDRITSRVTL